MEPLESCALCASGGAVRAISPDLGKSSISEMAQSYVVGYASKRNPLNMWMTLYWYKREA